MLKNCVFKIDVDTKDWFRSTIVRAIKTFAQTAGGMITVGAAMTDINWKLAFSVALVAAIYSVLTSIGGLPEVPATNTVSKDLEDTTYNEVEDLEEGDM
ncbi:holin [Anaerostipes sp. Marseille-Q3525]|jgi:hypothetical protein|uniref:holin n=1 Tax=Anaerostipes sp. Marseille-Q3525 TaxID=2758418 RepID=UPI001BAA905A|nr:holin [Anaerostipes sp. Marseille-Q3525]MBR9962264.1 holin [Anaerostipes sp. Marseille-Q3525]DAQ09583.1 MAG TPA: holin [Caudoviricetes sp.]